MNKTYLIFFISLFIATTNLYSVEDYTLSDLESLRKTNSFNEYLEHALDIRPAQRNKSWEQMTYSMGELLLDHINKKSLVEKSSFERVMSISAWPVFKDREFFIKKRDLIFLKYISNCFALKQNECEQLVKQIYTSFEHPKTFDVELVNLLDKYITEKQELIPYVTQVSQDTIGEFYCGKAPLREVVLDYLYQSVTKNEPIKVHKDCFMQIKKNVQSLLYSKDSHKRSGAKKMLEHYKLLSENQEIAYQLSEMLQESILSTKTKSHLQQLSKNYNKRDQVLSIFKKLDAIPDSLFKDYNDKKSLVQTKQLLKNFPEFIDYYANRCLAHLESKTTMTGNPTPNCHGLFKMNETLNLFPELTVKKYKKATYFIK